MTSPVKSRELTPTKNPWKAEGNSSTDVQKGPVRSCQDYRSYFYSKHLHCGDKGSSGQVTAPRTLGHTTWLRDALRVSLLQAVLGSVRPWACVLDILKGRLQVISVLAPASGTRVWPRWGTHLKWTGESDTDENVQERGTSKTPNLCPFGLQMIFLIKANPNL